MHDVQCKIQGPAVKDCYDTFKERMLENNSNWQDVSHKWETTTKMGSAVVQIGHTYGNGTKNAGIGKGGYGFAPNGRFTAMQMIREAIAGAQRFIYFEDQYLVSGHISIWLLQHLHHIEHLTMLTTPDAYVEGIFEMGPGLATRRNEFLKPLMKAFPEKVHVFTLKGDGPEAMHSYVHSKVWIIDDVYALVGSANCNRRSLTHDSEVIAGIYDVDWVKKFRIALWSELLGMPDTSALSDPIKSVNWENLPKTAKIQPYKRDESAWYGPNWFLRDPDGR
jgi:phosphatidylserine/phosphatidylglycerophosphate/cardiolipin synthase-like enzyme